MAKSEVQEIREKLGLTRHEFGRCLGLTYESLMNIENGVRNPSRLTLKLVRYMNSLPKSEAVKLCEKLNKHDDE